MNSFPNTYQSLKRDLANLKISLNDGLFVHSSMSAIGTTIGGPRTVVEAILSVVGDKGLVGMPGFSADAYFPVNVDKQNLTEKERLRIEDAVPGFDLYKSPTDGMGVIAETFRTWPNTVRSNHPTVSICLNGFEAENFLSEHSIPWATGENTPLGSLCHRPNMKILLMGVGWNRCSALHTAETLAPTRRIKTRRFKQNGSWIETPDVADDLGRLFEQTGAVIQGRVGNADCKVCDYEDLVEFARDRINDMNIESGDRC